LGEIRFRKTGCHFFRDCASSPPERFLGFADDVAPGQPDIVQVAIGPLRQFMPLLPPIGPDPELRPESRLKGQFMIICHTLT
jgi:hypothetical protein